MRFVWAVVAFVLATVMIGAGIAQRTIFQGPQSTTAEVAISNDEPYLVVGGDVLTSAPGSQTVRVVGDGAVFAAYGRTMDVQAWLADASYNKVVRAGDGALTTEQIEPTPTPTTTATATDAATDPAATDPAAPVDEGTTTPGAEEEAVPGRNPAGSDLWLAEYQQERSLTAPLQLPADMSVIIATDGTARRRRW